ncbi:hypothetical protein DRW07_00275 [Alteromonas sediminis]|uniref:STAS/SEC14 domain-containing protein n=1 Tax=Alteromonas sediminis TaxID=2259342 RepID=A0A3N5ZBP4_9ALTE|nr:hypothetical protein DRW07_00275 [Alteromonas sediminis]
MLFARLKGTWNKEAAVSFAQRFKAQAAPLVERPWGHVVYLDDWDLCSPDMFPVIESLVEWCIDNNLKRAAQIYTPSAMKRQFLDRMVVEEMGDFTRACFDCEEAALAWLESELENLDHK